MPPLLRSLTAVEAGSGAHHDGAARHAPATFGLHSNYFPAACLERVGWARRGSRAPGAPRSDSAIRLASWPLLRTTPMPERPGGVEIATMVSSVENIDGTDPAMPLARRLRRAAGACGR